MAEERRAKRTAVLSTKITAAEKKQFRVLAAMENLSMGGKLQRLIEDYVDGDSGIGVRAHYPVLAARIDRHGHPAEIPDAFGALHSWLQQREITVVGYPMILFPDAPFPEQEGPIHFSCLFPVAEDVEGDGTVRVGLLPAGEVLSILHRGPRETLPKAYGKIARAAEESAFELSPPGRHILLTAPYRAGREDALTEIQVPFRRGAAG
jgi:effector-binding domain-containing protein